MIPVEDVAPPLAARFAGQCPWCGAYWRPGDPISRVWLYDPDSGVVEEGRWFCGGCAELMRAHHARVVALHREPEGRESP